MKRTHFFNLWLLVFLVGGIGAVRVQAQPRGNPTRSKPQALAEGKALFRAGDFDRAETALTAGNRYASETLQWEVETGFGLIQVALRCREEGDGAVATVAAQRALQHLAQATRKTGARNAGEMANLYELIGRLYEDLMGDRDAAEAAYERAVNFAPGNGQAPTLLAQLRAGKAGEKIKGRR